MDFSKDELRTLFIQFHYENGIFFAGKRINRRDIHDIKIRETKLALAGCAHGTTVFRENQIIRNFTVDSKSLSAKEMVFGSLTNEQERKLIKKLMTQLSKISMEEPVEKEMQIEIENYLVRNHNKVQNFLQRNFHLLKDRISGEFPWSQVETFESLLEKISSVAEVIEFAICIFDFLEFLNKERKMKTVMPILLEMIIP